MKHHFQVIVVKKSRLHSTVETVAIASFREGHPSGKGAMVSCDTVPGVGRTRTAQIAAGRYAVISALLSLCRRLYPEGIFRREDFSIMHDPSGAPRIDRFPDFPVQGTIYTREMFFISISHTRTTAYGMAAVQQQSE